MVKMVQWHSGKTLASSSQGQEFEQTFCHWQAKIVIKALD
jgi:hypothetical protein